MNNPFPSRADLRREARAYSRDLNDVLRVSLLEDIVRDALARVALVSEIEHPDANWSVAEMADELRGMLTNLDGITDTLSGAVVLEDE
jgi:hypothetical protein